MFLPTFLYYNSRRYHVDLRLLPHQRYETHQLMSNLENGDIRGCSGLREDRLLRLGQRFLAAIDSRSTVLDHRSSHPDLARQESGGDR